MANEYDSRQAADQTRRGDFTRFDAVFRVYPHNGLPAVCPRVCPNTASRFG
ncbi:hypothetical protein PSAB6_300088 [Paraburkholderia sabiae]|nr:hypothetical protein PSAB6_300088 [Paraburkholderia sabiae]